MNIYVDEYPDILRLSDTPVSEELIKSIDRTKLVQKVITDKNGHRKKVWVRPDEAPNDKHYNTKRKPPEEPKNNQEFVVSKTARLDVPYQYFPKRDCGNPNTKPLNLKELNQVLMNHYNKNKSKYKCSYAEFRNGPLAKNFVTENFFISDGDSQTEKIYKVHGEYTPERMKLHKSIVKKIVDSASKPPEGSKPIAILMGGGSASGKGTVRKNMVLPEAEKYGFVPGICDSDDIKGEMPEYAPFQQQLVDTAAFRVHEESSDICNEAIDALVSEGKNLLFDGTMKNYQKYVGIIDKLHDAGYDVRIVGVDVPLKEAISRSDQRALHTGRKVPHSIISGSHGGFSLTFPQLIDKVDSYVLFDNSGDGDPIMVASSDTGVRDEALYDRFIQKGENHKKLKDLSKKYNLNFDELNDMFLDGASIEELTEYAKMGFSFD